MASSKIITDELVANGYIMDIDKAELYIKELVSEKMPMFKLVKESTSKGTYYYYFIFGYKEYEIMVGGERGGLEYHIEKNGEYQYDLHDLYPDIKKLSTASKGNIGLIIAVFEDYFKQKGILYQ